MARDDLHFRLRIPEALKALIEEAARANNRSMTAEMVSRLERSFDLDNKTEELIAKVAELEGGADDHDRRIDKLESQIADLMDYTGLHRRY